MAGMPGMEPDGDEPKSKSKGKGLDIAVIMGGGKPKPGSDDEDKGGGDLPPGFETAATEAFPEMAGDTERVTALWRAIKACDEY